MRYAALVLLITLASCSLEKKVAKDEIAADKLLSEAIQKNPNILIPQVRVDTVVMWTKAEAGAGGRYYSQQSMDSLATICAGIVAQYRNKADAAEGRARLTDALCRFETVTVADTALLLKIWAEDGKVRYWYNVLPQRTQKVIHTPTRVIQTNPPREADSRWRPGFWGWVGAFVCGMPVGFFLCLFMMGSFRRDPQ